MLLLLLIIGLAAVPMWLLYRHQRARVAGGKSQPAAPLVDVPRQARPSPSLGAVAAMPVAAPLALPVGPPVAALVAAPPICSRRSMPHEQRGECRNCHIVTNCPPARTATVSTLVPTITRTSLLPHAFVGVCRSCHVIRATPIEAVNRGTLEQFPVSDGDRALLMAGQQVVVPTPFHQLQAPVLSRETALPHAFVGVCSNCHRVLQTGSFPRTSTADLAQARRRLIDLEISDRQIAYARPAPQSRLLVVSMWAFGFIALGFFLLSMVYVVLKLYVASKPKSEQGKLRKRYQLKRWFQVHIWSSVGYTVAAVAHWLCSSKGNFLLHLSLLLLIVLTVSGVLLRYRVPRIKVNKKQMRWLHAQRVFTTVLVIAALIGHLLVQMK